MALSSRRRCPLGPARLRRFHVANPAAATDWTKQGYPKRTELAWFRFRLRAPAHTQSLVLELPAIEKSYQLFNDGKLIAQVGTLRPGPAHNVIGATRVFTLPVHSGFSAKRSQSRFVSGRIQLSPVRETACSRAKPTPEALKQFSITSAPPKPSIYWHWRRVHDQHRCAHRRRRSRVAVLVHP
jgi:hypothetical protein